MTKADIINEIAENTGIDKGDVQTTVEAFFAVVRSSLEEGENVYVRGFGSFVIKKRAKKLGRNISNQTRIEIEEHCVPSFKPAKGFIERIKASEKVKKAYLQEQK